MIVAASRSQPTRAGLAQNFLLGKIGDVIANVFRTAFDVVAPELLVIQGIPIDFFSRESQRDGKPSMRRRASMNDAILIAIARNVGERIERRRTFSEFF